MTATEEKESETATQTETTKTLPSREIGGMHDDQLEEPYPFGDKLAEI